MAERVSAIDVKDSDSYQCLSRVSFTVSTNHTSNVVFIFRLVAGSCRDRGVPLKMIRVTTALRAGGYGPQGA